jgi:hypothetical protein
MVSSVISKKGGEWRNWAGTRFALAGYLTMRGTTALLLYTSSLAAIGIIAGGFVYQDMRDLDDKQKRALDTAISQIVANHKNAPRDAEPAALAEQRTVATRATEPVADYRIQAAADASKSDDTKNAGDLKNDTKKAGATRKTEDTKKVDAVKSSESAKPPRKRTVRRRHERLLPPAFASLPVLTGSMLLGLRRY